MKYGHIVLGIAIGFIAGFITANVLSSEKANAEPSQQQADVVVKNGTAVNEKNQNTAVQQVTSNPSLTPSTDSDKTSSNDSDKAANDESLLSTTAKVTDTDINNDETTSFPTAQIELDQWITGHKSELERSMIEKLGEDSAQFMLQQVSKDNTFLNSPIADRPIEEDLATRFQKEQAIRAHVQNSTLDPQTRVLNVVCIQGRCELTLEGSDQSAAVFIYMELVNGAVAGLSELKTPTVYADSKEQGKGYWAYMLFSY